MADDDRTGWVVEKLKELINSLDIHRNNEIQSLNDVQVRDLIEIHRHVCRLPEDDEDPSSFEAVSNMVTYIKQRFGQNGGFNHLEPALIFEKDATQLKFLLQVLDIIHKQKLKSSRASRRTSKSKISTTVSSITNSSNTELASSNLISDAESSLVDSSKHSSFEPDSTITSGFGKSTIHSEDNPTDVDTTDSTINEVVLNILEESVHLLDKNPSTRKVEGESISLKVPTKPQFTSSKIEFDKDHLLMIKHKNRTSYKTLKLLSVSALDSSNLKPTIELSALGSDLNYTTTATNLENVSAPSQYLTDSNNQPSQINSTSGSITVASNNSTGQPTSNDDPSYTEPSDDEELDEYSDFGEESFFYLDVENEKNNGSNYSGYDTTDHPAKNTSEIDSGHVAVQELLREYLIELEHQINDLKNRKSSSIKPWSRMGSKPRFDKQGNIIKEKFPYYPFGIIYPKCKSILGNGPKWKPTVPFITNFNKEKCKENKKDKPKASTDKTDVKTSDYQSQKSNIGGSTATSKATAVTSQTLGSGVTSQDMKASNLESQQLNNMFSNGLSSSKPGSQPTNIENPSTGLKISAPASQKLSGIRSNDLKTSDPASRTLASDVRSTGFQTSAAISQKLSGRRSNGIDASAFISQKLSDIRSNDSKTTAPTSQKLDTNKSVDLKISKKLSDPRSGELKLSAPVSQKLNDLKPTAPGSRVLSNIGSEDSKIILESQKSSISNVGPTDWL